MSPTLNASMTGSPATAPFYNNSILGPLGNQSAEWQLRGQWENPNDILSLLLILGPDIVLRALAQVSGQRMTPVVFSYGWVAYAVNALVSAFGGPTPLS